MSAISTFKRYELKYLITDQLRDKILPEILSHMESDAYCRGNRPYTICNVYYDTVDSDLIRTSLAKPYHKEKLRLRSYSPHVEPEERVYLEIKKKTGGIVHKRRASMTAREAGEFIEHSTCPNASNYMDTQILGEIASFLRIHPVSPMTYIAYRRLAYFDRDDKDFRLTFDFDIKTRRTDVTLTSDDKGTQLLPPGLCLMEVKISGAVPLWLARLLSENKIYRTGFSKYGTEYKRSTCI